MTKNVLTMVHAVAEEGGLHRSVLGGISMGAATALEAATQAPDSLADLIQTLPPTDLEARPRQTAIYRRLSWVSGLFGAAPYRLLILLPVPVRNDELTRLSLNTAAAGGQSPTGTGRFARCCPVRCARAQATAPVGFTAPDSRLELRCAQSSFNSRKTCRTSPDVRDLVVCDASDLSDWQPAMLDFIGEVHAEELNAPYEEIA